MAALLLTLILGCASEPDWCAERSDDADCDGVPDAADRCAATPAEAFTDRHGCSENQTAGCTAALVAPLDGVREVESFRWSGDCESWRLEFSEDPDFPPGATRTAWQGSAQEVRVQGTERYWRVTGGLSGHPEGFSTAPREIRW